MPRRRVTARLGVGKLLVVETGVVIEDEIAGVETTVAADELPGADVVGVVGEQEQNANKQIAMRKENAFITGTFLSRRKRMSIRDVNGTHCWTNTGMNYNT